MKGFDTINDCTAHGQQILDAGYGFVARYYHSLSHSIKQKLTYAEAKHLSDMGIYLVAVFENNGDHPTYFTGQQGFEDGVAAFAYAQHAIQQPQGTPIYFAVDYDASDAELTHLLVPYFREVRASMGNYRIGVYGSGFVCRRLNELGLVSHTWLAQSTGWQESKTYNGWNLRQSMPTHFAGMDIDPDESNGNGGGFKVK